MDTIGHPVVAVPQTILHIPPSPSPTTTYRDLSTTMGMTETTTMSPEVHAEEVRHAPRLRVVLPPQGSHGSSPAPGYISLVLPRPLQGGPLSEQITAAAGDYYQGHVQGEPYQDPPVMAPPHYAMPPLWVQPSFLEGWCSSHVFHFSTGQLSSDQMHHRPAVLFLDSWARP
ncbi:hypothetical protein ZWY2020_028826 [Hordeum vulgare]|nr:hypothetical protein ZWY2020_028826 [Hordeum vulgare]